MTSRLWRGGGGTGLGEALDIREATPDVLREVAMRVLSDRECHARLSAFRQETWNAGGNTKGGEAHH